MSKLGETKVAHYALEELTKIFKQPFAGDNLISLKDVITSLEEIGYELKYPIPNHNCLLFLQRYQLIKKHYYSLGIINPIINNSGLHFEIHFDSKLKSSTIQTNCDYLSTEIYKIIQNLDDKYIYRLFNAEVNSYLSSYLIEVLGKNIGFKEEYFEPELRKILKK